MTSQRRMDGRAERGARVGKPEEGVSLIRAVHEHKLRIQS